MIIPFLNIGKYGVIKDLPDWQLPPEAWTSSSNVRFKEGAVWKVFGHRQFNSSPLIEAPQFVTTIYAFGGPLPIYCGRTRIGADNLGLPIEMTRASGLYSARMDDRWSATSIGGVPILTNSQDFPQSFNAATSKFQDLAAWQEVVRAKVIQAYKSHLVALGISKSGVDYPSLVKWSHPADPGTVPASWDETDPTKDAGEYTVGDRYDALVDAKPLGDVLVLYKTESVYAMTYIGGVQIFKFDKLFSDFGLLAKSCVVDLQQQHFVVTDCDILLHNGRTYESLLEGRLRRYLFKDINPIYYDFSFAFYSQTTGEVWFCYPDLTAVQTCNKALVWNKADNAFSFRDLPNVREGGESRLTQAAPLTFDEFRFAVNRGLVLPSNTSSRLVQFDRDLSNFAINFAGSVERTGMRFPADGELGMKLNSLETVKQIKSIQLITKGSTGARIRVSIGACNNQGQPTIWGEERNFVIGEMTRLDLMGIAQPSRLPALRLSGVGIDTWKISGYILDVEVQGDF